MSDDAPGDARHRHEHGGDPARDLSRFGLAPRPVIDFSANLSPLGPPRRVARLWPRLLAHGEPYPSLEGRGVQDFYRQRFGLAAPRVLPGNGATELIYLAPRALGVRRAAVLQPAYDDYRRACRVAGAEVLPLPLRPEEDFAPPDRRRWQQLLEGPLRGVDAVFLGHPNNPTGTLFEASDLRRLAAEWPEIFFFVDESFIQLTDSFPASSLAFGGGRSGELPANLLVFHSLTKFYALAGLRLGAVIGAPQTLERLRAVKEPWTVNGVAEQVARELADCHDYETRLRLLVREQRGVMLEALGRLPGLQPLPGSANFLLVRSSHPVEPLKRELLRRGFCVRDCANFQGLGEGYFRLAVRGAEENRLLLTALGEVLNA